MEIIPEFATPRDWMVYVFLILKSPATLRRAFPILALLSGVQNANALGICSLFETRREAPRFKK